MRFTTQLKQGVNEKQVVRIARISMIRLRGVSDRFAALVGSNHSLSSVLQLSIKHVTNGPPICYDPVTMDGFVPFAANGAGHVVQYHEESSYLFADIFVPGNI